MIEDNVSPKISKTVRRYSGLSSKQPQSKGGKAVHTYDLWRKTSDAERAAIVVRAHEVMNLISLSDGRSLAMAAER